MDFFINVIFHEFSEPSIEILMSEYVLGIQFLIFLRIILAPWIWFIQGHPGRPIGHLAAQVSILDDFAFWMDLGVPDGTQFRYMFVNLLHFG